MKQPARAARGNSNNARHCVKELKQLTTLDLGGTQVTDEGLRELKELKQLKELFLQQTKVTDAGVRELQEALPKCKINKDESNPPQKSGVASAGEADAVKLVERLGGKITRDDKPPGMPVNGVYLPRAKVTDMDLKALKELKQLMTLDLKFTPVTDVGLKELKELKQLTTLGLGATGVTDEGLKELKELKQLKELILRSCRNVTDAGVTDLQKALPMCKINR